MGIPFEKLPERIKRLVRPESFPATEVPVPTEGPEHVNRLEREEQRIFAQWCLLHDLPTVWHATHAPSKATPGCPDFVVVVNGKTFWIEFKLPGGRLSSVQEKFRIRLEAAGAKLHVVYSAAEAINLLTQEGKLS